jgi:hypothetical protein
VAGKYLKVRPIVRWSLEGWRREEEGWTFIWREEEEEEEEETADEDTPDWD